MSRVTDKGFSLYKENFMKELFLGILLLAIQIIPYLNKGININTWNATVAIIISIHSFVTMSAISCFLFSRINYIKYMNETENLRKRVPSDYFAKLIAYISIIGCTLSITFAIIGYFLF
jgi:uncharacterized membrane protein YesL